MKRARASYHLLGNHDNSLDGEFASTHVEQILERWSQEINAENVVKTLLSKVEGIGDSRYIKKERDRKRESKENRER